MSLICKYVICDNDTNFVYTNSWSKQIAYALCEGIRDIGTFILTVHNNNYYFKINNWEFFYDQPYTIDWRNGTMVEHSKEFLNADIIKTQEIIKLRRQLFSMWESHILTALNVRGSNHWQDFPLITASELEKCNPSEGHYSWLIEDYARFVELTPEEAYKTLKLRIESNQVIQFKITALAERWKNKINQATNFGEKSSILEQMRQEFWANGRI